MDKTKAQITEMSNSGNSRRYLTPTEIESLIAVTRRTKNRSQSLRNRLMILLAYHHGLRVSELVELEWTALDLNIGNFHITRKKNGIPSVHPLVADELRSLKQLRRQNPDSRFVFLSNRGAPMTRQNVNALLLKLGRLAGLEVPVFPHALRHATGYKLANQGVDTRSLQQYLGHRNIQNTVIYTQLNANRFNGWWS
jgi:site-specific recombinase XerD